MPEALADGLSERIELGAVVQRIVWQRGQVNVHTTDGRQFAAPSAIITVPLSVLHAADNPLVFEPKVPAIERTRTLLATGTVLRVALLFVEPFWEQRAKHVLKEGTLTDLSFVHATGRLIPVWWTAYPVRAPLLIGWAGGPKAAALSALKPVERALFFAGEAASGEGRNGTVNGAIATGYQAARRLIRAVHA